MMKILAAGTRKATVTVRNLIEGIVFQEALLGF